MKRLLMIAAVVLLLTNGLVAQEDDFVPSADLEANMAQIEQMTSEIRGLSALNPVTRLFPTRATVRDYLYSQLEGEEVEAQFAEATLFYIAFDFIAPDTDLLRIYSEFLADQIAGYYDTETKEMNVILFSGEHPETVLPPVEQIIYAHEFTHVLQDQHFELDALLDEELVEENPDAYQAILSLIEGDASYVMNEYTQLLAAESPLEILLQILIQGFTSGTLVIPDSIPKIIQRELLSPYNDGERFVRELMAVGGWELVNEAYRNPPASTEHILHPDKYLAGELPISVSLAPDDGVLGDDWTLIYERTLGEFYLREYLSTQVPPLDVMKAGSGWGGDVYRLYHNEADDQSAWILRLAWDTPEDAVEFFDVYTTFGDTRFETLADDNGCWSDAEWAICLTADGDETLISAAPTQEQAQRLLDGQVLQLAAQ